MKKLLNYYFPKTPITRTQFFFKQLAVLLGYLVAGLWLWLVFRIKGSPAGTLSVWGWILQAPILVLALTMFISLFVQHAMRVRDAGFKLRYGLTLVLLANWIAGALISFPLGTIALFFFPTKNAQEKNEVNVTNTE
ncbi:hypothetical protein [uncultured Endozoicomonas sp.]|uniref:hypothetical protein n=1 Tax=uncultured Endozoicomonas sp. TaxID=432652 RepID=UPI00261BBB02|nr:hypothetical protein [uncultured Endozoicomonas sp.]